MVDVVMDVWQANNNGVYDNIDNIYDHDCRVRVRIGKDGSYSYTTIMPAAYGGRNCLRPPHIHLRLAVPGYRTLVTQMYFAGNPLNGPNDCGCSFCGSGREVQQTQLDSSGRGRFDVVLTRAS
ncbi:hypothetical protein HYH03_005671 [Edaphochlamys debaryana]|uniref:Intradiol ring-cleavage dioxygenases domain-containing protein n=1 Tax=Edaphochlamys debaryana TaxID=47281 RepID=A0A835Y7G2_9CHLO|nr:hypothetical protein HYH03_005671 [Edaphochlamys debaryana]|eukprot:KAG2496447.1 hypothetical protein HYH03_005671 [Edaphochlamys debaryana]